MPTFLYHETIPCLVTFVRRVEAENYTAAEEAAFDGGGDLLGVSIGDTIPSVEEHHLLADEPHNIPDHFYPDLDGIQYWDNESVIDMHDDAVAIHNWLEAAPIDELAAIERALGENAPILSAGGLESSLRPQAIVARAETGRDDTPPELVEIGTLTEDEPAALALIHEIAALERDHEGDIILDGTTGIFDRIQSLAHRTKRPATWFTVWVAERSGQGTHFVQAFEAYSVEDAKRQAVAECAECWGYDQDEVEVLGVVAGHAKVIEWNDEGEN